MVNTFIVSTSLEECARLLDFKRLGKQRVEAKEIIDCLEKKIKGWKNHPAVKMWENNIDALKLYYNAMVIEWTKRGFNNNMELYDLKFEDASFWISTMNEGVTTMTQTPGKIQFPYFFGWKPIIYSHRASLIRKDPTFYTKLFLPDPDLDPYLLRGYVWPSKLPSNVLEHFSLDMCEKIGCGAPAKYRFTQDEIQAFVADPTINPRSGRALKVGGPLHSLFVEAARDTGFDMKNITISIKQEDATAQLSDQDKEIKPKKRTTKSTRRMSQSKEPSEELKPRIAIKEEPGNTHSLEQTKRTDRNRKRKREI